MHQLGLVFPVLQRRRLLLSRDQWVLLLVAVNQFFLALDTYLVHVLNGTIRPREWIPIIFGGVAGAILLLAGLLALRNRATAALLVSAVFVASMVVGILGAYFHFIRGILPTAPPGSRVSLDLLIWAPPILAPFAFAGVGVLGLSAAWEEEDPDSGRLRFFSRIIQLPYSKTRAYLLLISLGTLVALISSSLDHARASYANPAVWVPVVVGLFSIFVTVGLALIENPSRLEVEIYIVSMVLLIFTGLIGAYFHVAADLTSQNIFIAERFLRGAPFLSPLLYSNMGLLGLVILLDPAES